MPILSVLLENVYMCKSYACSCLDRLLYMRSSLYSKINKSYGFSHFSNYSQSAGSNKENKKGKAGKKGGKEGKGKAPPPTRAGPKNVPGVKEGPKSPPEAAQTQTPAIKNEKAVQEVEDDDEEEAVQVCG